MKIAVSFTGGKDSVITASGYQMLARGKTLPDGLRDRLLVGIENIHDIEVVLLVTFVPAGGAPFKAHPLPIVSALAQCMETQHVVKEITGPDYLASYVTALQSLATEYGVEALATGDILDVCSNFMGRAAQGAGMPLLRPLWGIPREELLHAIWSLGIQPIITCVNVTKFKTAGAAATTNGSVTEDPSHPMDSLHYACTAAGTGNTTHINGVHASIDPIVDLLGHALTRDLHAKVVVPAGHAYGVDQAGELGEFHTMCVDGPTYTSRLEVLSDKLYEPGSDFAYLVPSSIKIIHKTETAATAS